MVNVSTKENGYYNNNNYSYKGSSKLGSFSYDSMQSKNQLSSSELDVGKNDLIVSTMELCTQMGAKLDVLQGDMTDEVAASIEIDLACDNNIMVNPC